jgi:hypothetical protein
MFLNAQELKIKMHDIILSKIPTLVGKLIVLPIHIGYGSCASERVGFYLKVVI